MTEAPRSAVSPRLKVLTIRTGPFQENCYLVVDEDTKQGLLLDPGADPVVIADVVGGEAALVGHILLTHGHFDHVGAVAELTRTLHLTAHCHENEVKLIRRAPFYAIRFVKRRFESPSDVVPFSDGPILDGADFAIQTIHTPGHTSGSVCYALGGYLFTGDTLFHRFVAPTNYPESEPKRLSQSIDELLASTLSPDTILLPGHGRPWVLGAAREWWAVNRSQATAFQIGRQASSKVEE